MSWRTTQKQQFDQHAHCTEDMRDSGQPLKTFIEPFSRLPVSIRNLYSNVFFLLQARQSDITDWSRESVRSSPTPARSVESDTPAKEQESMTSFLILFSFCLGGGDIVPFFQLSLCFPFFFKGGFCPKKVGWGGLARIFWPIFHHVTVPIS